VSRRTRRAGPPEFTLTDTGPLVALVNANDPYHEQASSILSRLPKVPLVTTWPCLTEVMYLLFQAGGYSAQDELWEWVADGLLRLHLPSEDEWRRMRALMAQYRDAPMDLADASVVVAAEVLSTSKVFTLDRHFHAYRLEDGGAMEIAS